MKSEPHLQAVCGKSVGECLRIIEQFHGWRAPGLLLGMYMVDWALELIGEGVEADAIVETRHCLPDAVQLFTPCTVGNGWLKIIDWDCFAVTLYDRRELSGFRVHLDLGKTEALCPDLFNWFMRRVPKRSLPLEVLEKAILGVGRSVLTAESVVMTDAYKRIKKSGTAVCPSCGESFGADRPRLCPSCRGEGYCSPLEPQSASGAA
jgi:formylmethanofuran dehydrogenase subunit E